MKFWLQRLAMVILLLLAVSFVTFTAMNILGDPLFNILGPIAGDTENPESVEKIEAAKAQYYLDRPFVERYGRWLGDFATGDLGVRFASDGQPPVTDLIGERLPRSALLMVMAQTMAIVIAIPWGISEATAGSVATASPRRKWLRLGRFFVLAAFLGWVVSNLDTAFARSLLLFAVVVVLFWARRPVEGSATMSFMFISLPGFALGILLKYLFAIELGWFPLAYNAGDPWLDRLHAFVLPALTLALPAAAVYQRLLRTDLITTLQEDFILMARAKGVKRRSVLFRHALRPSMFSVITVFGLNAGALMGGALIVETIFEIPGLGRAVVEAILREDFPVVLAIVMIVATAFVVLNFLVDLLYTFLDPRVRT